MLDREQHFPRLAGVIAGKRQTSKKLKNHEKSSKHPFYRTFCMLFYPQRNPDDAEKAIFLTAVEVEQDETTNAFLRGAAVCGQDRPGEQRLLAAALDAPAGYGGYYGVSGAEVAAEKRPSAHRIGRGPADTDRLLFGVGA
ncbi:MAG: hypothetical protein KH177_09400 [Faecalibacterium prausnitzii]|nr:hypothetical protein [Faecalibacterium prausnitzii]